MKAQNALKTTLAAGVITLGVVVAPAGAEASGVAREPSAITDTERALDRYQSGIAALDQDALADSARHFREAISLDPTLLGARRYYARILATTGRIERAETVLKAGLEFDPHNVPTARLLARIAAEADHSAVAIEALEAIRPPESSNDTYVRAHLANHYREAGRYEKASAVYARLHAIEPDNPDWRIGRAFAEDRFGATDSAITAWQAVVDHDDKLERSIIDYAKARIEALGGKHEG